MSISKTPIPLRLRYLAILLGMVFFLWLPFEDTSESIALLGGILTSTWLAAVFLTKKQEPQTNLLNYVLAGSLAGILVTPITLLLMVLKTGLHAHVEPDFTYPQIVSVVQRTPIWLIGGFLVGLGRGLWLAQNQADQPVVES